MQKEEFKNLIKELDINNQFPDWVWNFDTHFLSHSPEKEWIKFQITRTLKQVVESEFRAGNEQRPQATLLGQKKGKGGTKGSKLSSQKKEYWDKVLMNGFVGEIMDGPLNGIIKNFNATYIPNWLHRFFMFRFYNEGTWEVETKNPYKSSIEDDIFNEVDFSGNVHDLTERYGKDFVNRLWNQPVTSTVYYYYSDDHEKNLKNKSIHFKHSNGNLGDEELLHSYETRLNRFIKERFGYRLETLKKEGNIYKESEYLDYEKIRNNCPFPLIKQNNIKGYDEDGNRIMDTGYHYAHQQFQELKVYLLGLKLTYIYYFKNNLGECVDMTQEDLENWIQKDIQFDDKWIRDYESKLDTFYKFYSKLWDININQVVTNDHLFGYSQTNILSTWMLFLELDELGKFTDYWDSFSWKENSFYSQLVEMFKTFKLWHPHASEEEKDTDYYGLRRTISSKERQEKMKKLIHNTLVSKRFEQNYLDVQSGKKIPIKFEFDTSGYLLSNFRFHQDDKNRLFSRDTSTKRWDDVGRQCEVTGQEVPFTSAEAHHKIWYDHGGSNEYKNCMMVTKELNQKWFKEHNCDSTSHGIRKLIEEQPEKFTKEKLDFWLNGGIQDLESYERDINNYYWPIDKK